MHCQCSVHSSTGLWPALTVPVRASGRYLMCSAVQCGVRNVRENRIEYNTCQQSCSTCINNCIDNRINNLTGRPYLSLSIYLPTPTLALRDVARRFPHAHISNACVGFGIRRSYHVGSHDVWLAVVPLLVVSRDNSASTVGRRNTCNSSCSASARSA